MQRVEIRVEGHLDASWADWLENFTITHLEGGETILTGVVKDQAVLYGLIAKLRDLGMKLITVNMQADQNEISRHDTQSL
jgi:hypothetical protein